MQKKKTKFISLQSEYSKCYFEKKFLIFLQSSPTKEKLLQNPIANYYYVFNFTLHKLLKIKKDFFYFF